MVSAPRLSFQSYNFLGVEIFYDSATSRILSSPLRVQATSDDCPCLGFRVLTRMGDERQAACTSILRLCSDASGVWHPFSWARTVYRLDPVCNYFVPKNYRGVENERRVKSPQEF